MSDPELTLLIPTYKRPDLLRRAIESVLAQEGARPRVIVGDDGDLGGAVVEAIGDERVRYVKHPQRLGIAGNWTALLDLADTPLVALLMDDDVLDPAFARETLAALAAHPDAGVAFTNHRFDDGTRVWDRETPVTAGRHERFLTTFLEHRPVAVSAAVMRAEAWRDARPLPDTGAADMILFARIADAGWPFVYVDRPLMTYRAFGDMYSQTLSFRDETVTAWRALSFADAGPERLRRTLLADSLLGRASAALREGDRASARRDVEEARTLGPSSQRRALALAAATRAEPVARLARRVMASSRRRPW